MLTRLATLPQMASADGAARARSGKSADPNALLRRRALLRLALGITARIEDGALILDMPFDPKLIGNPILPALHGGVIGSLLETAAIVQTIWETGAATAQARRHHHRLSAHRRARSTSYARACIARQGRRVVNARAEMWQEDAAKPVASFRGHFLLA